VLLYVGLIGKVLAEDPVKITGLHIHGDTERKISYLDGNVRLVQGKMVITTNKATVYTDKKQVVLEQNVRLVNPDGSVTADRLEYDFRQKSGTFRGNVILKRKASRDLKKKTQKEPFTLYAQELFLETKTQNFTGCKCRFEHKDFNGTAGQVIYDDDGETMSLQGDVDLKRPQGELLQGDQIRIGLKDKSFIATGRTNVQLEVDDETDKTKREPVKAAGDVIRGDTDKKITYLEGNVRIAQGAELITTDKATIDNGPKKRAVLETNVKLENKDGMVAAAALDYDLRKKAGTFRGKVVMRRKASRDPKNKVKRDPFILRCNELFLETKTKNFIATRGNFEHQDFKGSADQMVYHDKDEELIFRGHVDLKRTTGETINGEETRIYLKDKSFVATNQVKVQIEIDDSEPEPSKPQSNKSKRGK
jgi:lipopolysaccharide export system protein LptA